MSRTSGRTSIGTPKTWHRAGSKPGLPSVWSWVREIGRAVGGEARAEAIAEERIDSAHPEPARLLRLLHGLVVLEQPGELGRGEVGVEGQAALLLDLVLPVGQAVEDLLRALVLPDDDRAEGLAGLGVPGEHRLALVVEAAGHDLAGRLLQQLGHGLHDRGQHLLAVLLDPARLGVAVLLVAAGLSHRLEALVEEHRLDGGCALVDAEGQW